MIKCSWLNCKQKGNWKQTDKYDRTMYLCNEHIDIVKTLEPQSNHVELSK